MLGGVGWFSVSRSGTLAYVPGPTGPASNDFDLVVVERNEIVTPMKLPPGLVQVHRACLPMARHRGRNR